MRAGVNDVAIGTSIAVVEKFPSNAAHAEARRLISSKFRERPREFGVLMDPTAADLPPEAYGNWSAQELIERALAEGIADVGVVDLRPIRESKGSVSVTKRMSRAAWHRRIRRIAETLREFTILDALGLADELCIGYGNLWLNEGINEAWLLITGGGGTAFNNANAKIGVGDSSTAAAATQTDLQAASNKTFVAMDGGFPTSGSSQQAAFKGTFGDGVGSYAWNEWTVRNGASESAAKNLMRKVESTFGTKGSTGSWALTATATLA